jgi:hypothetical protein
MPRGKARAIRLVGFDFLRLALDISMRLGRKTAALNVRKTVHILRKKALAATMNRL